MGVEIKTQLRRWLRVPDAVEYSGFSRAFLYKLLASRSINSRSVRGTAGAKRGIRLVDKESIDRLISESGQ